MEKYPKKQIKYYLNMKIKEYIMDDSVINTENKQLINNPRWLLRFSCTFIQMLYKHSK